MESPERSVEKQQENGTNSELHSSKVSSSFVSIDTSQIPHLMRTNSSKRILNQRPSNANTKKLRMRSLLWVKPHANEQDLTSSLIKQVVPVSIVNLAMLSVGMSLGFSAIALPQLKESSHQQSTLHIMSYVSEEEGSWIAGIYGFGAIFGGVAAAVLGSNLGRRKGLLILLLPDILGWLLIALSQNLAMMLVGRFLCGFSSAGYYPTIQIFVAEVAQPKKRGWLNAISIPTIASGTLMAYVIGTFSSWWIVAVLGGIIPAILVPLMAFIPDSPYWYLQNGQERKALRVMEKFRSSDANALAELLAMSDSLGKISQLSAKDTLERLMHRQYRRPFLMLNFLFILMAFSGKYSIGFYAVDIFHKAAGHVNEYYSTICIGVIRVIGSILYPFAIRKCSRRTLLMTSSSIMAICLGTLGLTMYSNTHEMIFASWEWVPIACVTMYIIADSLGLGSIPYLYLGEFFPSEIRSAFSGITVSLSNLEMFLLVKTFPNMNESLGDHGTFWVYAGVCFITVFFTLFFVPETKGKSLQEIENEFAHKENLHVTPYVTPQNTPMASKRRGFDKSIEFTL